MLSRHKWIQQIFFPVLTAFIWGSAFVFQSVGAEKVGFFTFNAGRGIVACVSLFIILLIRRRITKKPIFAGDKKKMLLGGILCGLDITLATNLQQLGLATTGPGKAGFITALYIVLVPVLGLLLRRKTTPIVWICMAIAAVGLYLLCVTGEFTITAGDTALLICAVAYALHIILVDSFAQDVDGFVLSFIQFTVVTVISGVLMLLFEKPTMGDVVPALPSIIYVGFFSSAIAYTLQILSQQGTDASMVSLLFSLESVFATICGAIFIHERMSLREYAGCALVLVAVVLPQIKKGQGTDRQTVDKDEN